MLPRTVEQLVSICWVPTRTVAADAYCVCFWELVFNKQFEFRSISLTQVTHDRRFAANASYVRVVMINTVLFVDGLMFRHHIAIVIAIIPDRKNLIMNQ